MSSLTLEAKTITFQDVELLIYDTIHKFIREHGGNFQDFLSEAHEVFLVAYETHDDLLGSFTYWLTFKLKKHMMELTRRAIMRNNRLSRVDADLTMIARPEAVEPFDWRRFASDLSDDAATVVKLVFEEPIDVTLAILQREQGPTPKAIRSSIREYLRDLGWTVRRISESFSEVARALFP